MTDVDPRNYTIILFDNIPNYDDPDVRSNIKKIRFYWTSEWLAIKKVKSDRVNALRKQYDAFLEEDKKRKERNEYILGKLDNIRYNSTAVQIRKPIVYGEVYPAYNRISYRPDHRAVQIAHPPGPIYQNHREIDVPTKYTEDTSLLKEISKKYILIPKLRPSLIDDYVETVPSTSLPSVVQSYGQSLPKKDITSEDWTSKYDILEQLKNNEVDQVNNKYSPIDVPVKDNQRGVNDVRNHTTTYGEDIPEKDTGFTGINKEAYNLDNAKTNVCVEPSLNTHNESIQKSFENEKMYDKSVQRQNKPKVDDDINLVTDEHSIATSEAIIENDAPQNTDVLLEPHLGENTMQQAGNQQLEINQQEQYKIPGQDLLQEQYPQEQYQQEEQYPQEQHVQEEQYQQEQLSQENYQEQDQYAEQQYTDQQYPQEPYEQEQYPQEQEYLQEQYPNQEQYSQDQNPQEQHPSQDQQENYKDIIHHESEAVYPDPEKVYLDKDDYSPIEVVSPSQLVDEICNEKAVAGPNNEGETYPVDLLNTEDFTPTEGVNLTEGENVNPVYLASDETVKEHRVPAENSGIDDFDAEQREMFYSEQTDAYTHDQQVADAIEYDQQYVPDENYEGTPAPVYYEGADELQQQAYPVEINEHEETSTRYDQNYEQQYANQYDEQTYQQEQDINYEAPLEAYEPPQQQEYQFEQPDTLSAQNIEQDLDREQGFADNVGLEVQQSGKA